jgi:DNA-binding MarR family transcriptional regulator
VVGNHAPVPREPRIRVVPIGDSPGRKLSRAHTRLQQGLTQLFQQGGYPITTEGWALLNQLWVEDRLTQLELGQRLEKDGPTTSRLVDALERENFVHRSIRDHDRRVREIGLTERGRAARVPLTRIATEFLEEVFDGISGPQLEAFGRILDHIVERFDSRSANTDDRDTSSRSNHRTRTKNGSKHVEGSGRPRHRL